MDTWMCINTGCLRVDDSGSNWLEAVLSGEAFREPAGYVGTKLFLSGAFTVIAHAFVWVKRRPPRIKAGCLPWMTGSTGLAFTGFRGSIHGKKPASRRKRLAVST